MELDYGNGGTTLNILKKHLIVHLHRVNFMVYELYVCLCLSAGTSMCLHEYKTLYNCLQLLLRRPGSDIELGSGEIKQRREEGTQFYPCIFCNYNSEIIHLKIDWNKIIGIMLE